MRKKIFSVILTLVLTIGTCSIAAAADREFHHIGASAARDGHSCFLRMCMIHKVMY